MRSERQLRLLGAVLAVLALSTLAGAAIAHPPSDPDHGTNETRFPILWSGDKDGTVRTVEEGGRDAALRQLANGTDLPLNAPPRDVERWNAGDIDDFPETNRSVSIRPTHADTGGGRFIEDAHATLFAIQPSTRARLSSSDRPLYVGREGEVFGTADYRIRVPEDDTTGDRQVYWSVEEHRIDETRLVIDGETVATASGGHTPAFDFEDLDPGSHRIAIEADVFVKLEKHVRTEETECEYRENTTHCYTDVDHDYSYPTETITVQDDRSVVGYELSVSGERASFPDGSTGLALTADQPWLGHSLPNGNVTGTWRLYSARDPSWDTLVYNSTNDSTRRHSPLHPLQVNAFPLEMGASASQPTARVVGTDGERRDAPTLPEHVNLDVANGSYTGSETLVTRTSNVDSTLEVRGLVRGVSQTIQVSDLDRIPIHESNLSLSVVNESESRARVEIALTDESTGDPIATADRDGFIVIGDERMNTTSDGRARVTLEDPGVAISARYAPGDWWNDTPGYVRDSQTMTTSGPSLQVLATLFRFAVPVGLFLLAAYLIDRITTWRIWPPWRGL
ncbi:MAG: hypothetical protein ACOCQY_04385 [Halorhabdus sp.]